jgi:gluconolactonase
MPKIFRDPKELMKKVEFFDESSKQLFSKDKIITKIFEGCLWAEGPIYLKEKNILVWSDIPYNRMLYYNLSNQSTGTYRYPSNFSNGNSVDLEGFMITAEHGRRAISRTNKDGSVEIITNQIDGNRYNSPNDLVCKSDGTIWFTDPQYGIMSNYEGYESRSETKYNGVYLIDKSNNVKLLTYEIDAPNGIAFSPNEKTIYITDTGTTGNIFSFDVIDNAIKNKKVFATPRPGKPDGIKVDSNGNVFSSSWDGVQIYSPNGNLIAKIHIPEQRTANLCFGGENFNQLFIASDKSLYKIKMETSGNKVN